jgi:hypothetical protein
MLWRWAVVMLWHALLFLGLRFFPPFFFLLALVAHAAFSFKHLFNNYRARLSSREAISLFGLFYGLMATLK